MTCEFCESSKSQRVAGRVNLFCLGCCARLVQSANPEKRLAAGHLAAIERLPNAPIRSEILDEVKKRKSNQMTITLTLHTLEQAQAVKAALDLYVRMGLGQFNELAYLARFGEIKHKSKDLTSCELDEFEDLTKNLSDFMGHEYGSSFGVGSPRVTATAHRCYEAYKVLAQALAVARDPSPTGFKGVDYDGLTVRYTQDPEPEAEARIK